MITRSQRAIACLLLTCQLLTSCYGKTEQVSSIPSEIAHSSEFPKEENQPDEKGMHTAHEAQLSSPSINNIQIELAALEKLKRDYPTPKAQMARITELIKAFGNKSLAESQKAGTGKFRSVQKKVRIQGKIQTQEVQQEIMQTISSAEQDVLDIMCLGQLLFEGGNNKIHLEMKMMVLKAEMQDVTNPSNLEYLEKCLTNFKPAIYDNLKAYYAEKYQVDRSKIKILPKKNGQQVGAKVVIANPQDENNPHVFYIKSHQEFTSKSHPQLGTQTSNGVGYVDLKELFMYKVLEKLGYGPKTEFIIDKNITHPGLEEGIMIATQDSGYTKKPAEKEKSFKTFGQIYKELEPEAASTETRKDLIAIDMLSRIFCLSDVMVNAGNFGRVDRITSKTKEAMPDKWKILDLMTPKIESVKKNRYNYTQFNKKYGKDIAGSFIDRNGNPAHTYDPESSISDILGDQKTEDWWQATISTLTTGKRPPHKVGIKEAIDESKTAIIQFLEANKAVLKTKNEEGQWKEQTQRRIDDLNIYCTCANQNFDDLVQGIQEYHKRELATQQATAASSNAGNPARAKD